MHKTLLCCERGRFFKTFSALHQRARLMPQNAASPDCYTAKGTTLRICLNICRTNSSLRKTCDTRRTGLGSKKAGDANVRVFYG